MAQAFKEAKPKKQITKRNKKIKRKALSSKRKQRLINQIPAPTLPQIPPAQSTPPIPQARSTPLIPHVEPTPPIPQAQSTEMPHIDPIPPNHQTQDELDLFSEGDGSQFVIDEK